jgi:hypothetical protein
MRIRVVKTPSLEEVDGIRLDQFRPVGEYRLGNSLAALFLAEGWGEPVAEDEPEMAVPPIQPPNAQPPNLVRERFPPYYGNPLPVAADRRRSRRRS